MPSLDFSQAWPWLQWVLAVAAVVTFVGGAIRVVPPAWRALTLFVKTINALSDLPDELEKQAQFRAKTATTLANQDTKIDQIHHEVNYNNGTSVKDAVSRVESAVAAIRVDQTEDRAAAGKAVKAAGEAVTEAQRAAQLAREALERSSKGDK